MTQGPGVPATSPTLVGPHVLLRAATDADAPSLLEVSFYDGVAATSPEDARRMLARIVDDQARGETIHWAIVDRAHGEVAGTVGFYRGFAGGDGEVGYVLRRAFRGRGLMTEAVGLAVDYGLGTFGLARVIAYVDADNVPSIAVLERGGFVAIATEGDRRTYARTA